MLEAGAWPVLETVQDDTTSGMLESQLTWFLPFKDYGLVAFHHYRTNRLDVELVAANTYLYQELEASGQMWNDPKAHEPPPGWRWFGMAPDWIIKWKGRPPPA